MDFSFRSVMKILMEDVGLTPPKLAERLDRERSLVNKWMTGRHKPRPAYIPQIVDIILKQGTVSQAIVTTAHLKEFVHASALPKELKDILLSKSSDCKVFLLEALTVSLNDIPVVAEEAPQRIKTRLIGYLSVPIYAAASALIGGVLWNLSNHLFGWAYYMGSPGGDPYGLSAFIWGLLTFLPIAAIAALLSRKVAALWPMVVALVAYSIVGSLSALLFYTSGIRAGVEDSGLPYALREITIVIIYSLIISLPPYVTLRVFMKNKLNSKATALHILLPVFASLFAVVLTLFVGRPEIEVAGVRGLLVGILMKSCISYVTVNSLNRDAGSVPASHSERVWEIP